VEPFQETFSFALFSWFINFLVDPFCGLKKKKHPFVPCYLVVTDLSYFISIYKTQSLFFEFTRPRFRHSRKILGAYRSRGLIHICVIEFKKGAIRHEKAASLQKSLREEKSEMAQL